MAHHRLGRKGQVRASLEDVSRLWREVEAARAGGAVPVLEVDWLALQLLGCEAEARILYDPVFPADPFAR